LTTGLDSGCEAASAGGLNSTTEAAALAVAVFAGAGGAGVLAVVYPGSISSPCATGGGSSGADNGIVVAMLRPVNTDQAEPTRAQPLMTSATAPIPAAAAKTIQVDDVRPLFMTLPRLGRTGPHAKIGMIGPDDERSA
jgi:hypothetical protein